MFPGIQREGRVCGRKHCNEVIFPSANCTLSFACPVIPRGQVLNRGFSLITDELNEKRGGFVIQAFKEGENAFRLEEKIPRAVG